jgi:hypothetical protein
MGSQMTNPAMTMRSVLAYGICLPLAVYLGYLIAGPADMATFSVFGLLGFLLVFPLLLRWHHTWLIATWNMSMLFLFLPGQPTAWFVLAFVSFIICMGRFILTRRPFLHAPGVSLSLIALGLVVLATAKLTGGLGLKVMGDAMFGGKRYVLIWMAILGYFALISEPVAPEKRKLLGTLFIVGGITQVIGELAAFISPAFYFIFLIFPPDVGSAAMVRNQSIAGEVVYRWGGLANGSMAVVFALLGRYGIRGIMTSGKLWRPALFAGCFMLSLFGGYRSVLILIAMTFCLMFYLEGLLRTRLLPMFLLICLLGGAMAMAFADRMPLSIQRALSVLPLNINPVAQSSADASSGWRVEMWGRVIPQIPKYLIIGKGYSFSASEAAMATATPNAPGTETSVELAGDYHNGPLSVIIPFGIFGSLAFLWFLYASFKVLRDNRRYGPPDCHIMNTFLLASYIAKVIGFFMIFGGFYSDIAMFAGIVGVSISLNGGVAKPSPVSVPKIKFGRFSLSVPAGPAISPRN